MKAQATAAAKEAPQSAAVRSDTGGSGFVDARPEATAQRELAAEIRNGAYVTAQRQRLRGMFGDAAQRKRSDTRNDTGLPDGVKSGIESLSGISLDSVNVHYNSSQPAQLNALAYAQGSEIHVAPGQERHVPHEAWHVVQQAQGRVKPTIQMRGGVPVNDDEGLEREADVMGARASAMQMKMKPAGALEIALAATPVVQRVTTQILPDTEDGKIGGVAIIGRPPQTFSGSMGDHTTAFTVIASGLENRLTGKTIVEASIILAKLVHSLYQLPGMQLAETLPKEHAIRLKEALDNAHWYVNEFRGFRKKKEQNEFGFLNFPVENQEEYEFSAGLVSHMQNWVDAYLEARELVPLSTINTKALNAPLAGKGKGESTNSLIASEKDDNFNYQNVLNAAVGLFDARSAATVCLISNENMLTRIAPGVPYYLDPESKRNLLVRQHIQTLYSFYPKTMDTLEKQGGVSALGKQLHENVTTKMKETEQAWQGEKKQPQKKGPRVQKEGKRYLATAISVDENDMISDVKIGGRGTSPYANTMGAHTTAWTVLTDVVWSELVGMSLLDGAEKLLEIANKTIDHLKQMSTLFQADEKQIDRLRYALDRIDQSQDKLIVLVTMKELIAEENQEQPPIPGNNEMPDDSFEEHSEENIDQNIDQNIDENIEENIDENPEEGNMETGSEGPNWYSPWEQLLILQEAVNNILDVQNLTPGASLYVGNVNGAREGAYRGVLLNFERQKNEGQVNVSKPDVVRAIMGLLDLKGLDQHLKTTQENLHDRTKYQHREMTGEESDKLDDTSQYFNGMEISEPTGPSDFKTSLVQLIKHHFEMIGKAYPDALEYAGLAGELNLQAMYQMSLEYSQDEGFTPDEDDDEDDY